MAVEDDEIAKTEEVSSCHCPVPPPHCLSAPNQAFCPDLLRLSRSTSARGMSLGTAIAELQSRFDQLARSKGGNPATYGTQGGKGQQPKRKNNPAHVAGAIAVLKALNKEVALPMQVLSRGAEVRAYLSISTENERLGEPPIYLSLEMPCAFEMWSLSPEKKTQSSSEGCCSHDDWRRCGLDRACVDAWRDGGAGW